MPNGIMKTCLGAVAVLALATPAHAQRAIPVRTLTAPVGTDSGVLKAYNNIRPLRDGHLLVNDFSSRRLLLFDSTLARFTVLLDSAGDAVARYGPQQGILFPYVADSTVLIDQTARAFAVVDPAGKVGRTMAIPSKADMRWLMWAANLGEAGYDPAGRLIYRSVRSSRPRAPNPPPPPDSGRVQVELRRDSVVIVRVDPSAGTLDTIAYLALAASKSSMLYTGRGYTSTPARNPLPTTDEWALLPDGTAAIVRGHDYHIDWVRPNGSTNSTAKLPFDWKRLTDEDKQKLIDSAKAAHARQNTFADSVRRLPPPPPPMLDDAAGGRQRTGGGAGVTR